MACHVHKEFGSCLIDDNCLSLDCIQDGFLMKIHQAEIVRPPALNWMYLTSDNSTFALNSEIHW